MATKLRFNAAPIPADATGRVKGTAFDIKCFPPSQSGRMAPFRSPPQNPAALPSPTPTAAQTQKHFDDWLAFFVDQLGSKLEKLNGLQFNLDKSTTGGATETTSMSAELGALATALGMTLSGTVSNPPDLTWPLTGDYQIVWSAAEAKKIGFGSLVLDLDFQNEPDYRMVVNCIVELITTTGKILAPVSSSSSYIATSSSS
jgi:hypothetical protein